MAISKPGRRLLALALLGVAGYYALWGGEYSAFDLRRMKGEQAAAEAELAARRGEADSLRSLAQTLAKSDTAVERIARERFGMVRDGEMLYRFVPVDSGAAGKQQAPRP